MMRASRRNIRSACGQFTPELEEFRVSRRSSALLITLTILALVTILVVAFLGLASQDLKSTNFYVHSQQADQIARGGLDFVVGNLQGEIMDAALSANAGSAQTPFYIPQASGSSFPMRMVTLGAGSTNIIVTSASSTFYTGGSAPSTRMSAIPSTNISLNSQVVTASAWNKPMLVPAATASSIPIPNWVFITRTGPTASALSPTAASSTVSPSLGNSGGVIGRYAFMVYDTSGLMDINVAGYDPTQPSMATNAVGKGLLPYADLTQLPGVATTDLTNMVSFRNAISETNYPQALYNTNGFGLQSNGFMQVYALSTNGPSDSTFLSRQELIQYATSVDSGWSNALPYLTTFSREFNGPTWGPTAPDAFYNGTNYNYHTLASSTSTATINAKIYIVTVPTSWVGPATTRNNGTPWVAGEPLVKYRFPLDKLALLQSIGTTYTYSDWQANKDNIQTNIQKYFGLDLVSDSNGFYRHWQYPTASTVYAHTSGGTTSYGQILTLAQVAQQTTPREPDFFELLQAGILNGSLGAWGRNATGGILTSSPAVNDTDPKTTLQTLRIGANIMNQWDSDSYPVTISLLTDSSISDAYNVYGIADLPYITQMFTKAYSPNGICTTPICPYVYFQIWNPHQAPATAVYNSANYPSSFRIVPFHATTSGNLGNSDSYWLRLISSPFGTSARWNFDPGTQSYAPTTVPYFHQIPTGFGGGDEALNTPNQGLNFTFNTLSNYREPGLVVGTPAPGNNGAGTGWSPPPPPYGGSPSSPSLAAISLPQIPFFPPDATKANQPSTSTVMWTNSTMVPLYQLNWQTQTVWVLQYLDQGLSSGTKTWRTYSTFMGLDTGNSLGVTGWNVSNFEHPGTNNGVYNSIGDQSWAKSDPRTFRLGMSQNNQVLGEEAGKFSGTYLVPTNTWLNATSGPLQTPTSLAWNMTYDPSVTPNAAAIACVNAGTNYPFRMDYWVSNASNNAPSAPYMADNDGIVRGGDSVYAYSATTANWGSNPLLPSASYATSALPARPVILNHPFHSVGDLGYAYRDNPWRTLDFMTPGSADAALLDLFSLSEAPLLAGRINPNTPYAPIVQSLMNGATQSSVSGVSTAAATVTPSVAALVAQAFVNYSPSAPITNRASMITGGAISNVINSSAFTDSGSTSMVKSEGESVVRAMAESANTRTWNLLIDVIGQSGHFVNNSVPLSSGGQDNFVVEGERRYWLHVAIDRYTGKIVDQQLELVDH